MQRWHETKRDLVVHAGLAGSAFVSTSTAIVTMIVGDAYRRLWQEHCRANWERYAARHGFDLIALDAPLDHSPRARARSLAWQKLLLLGQEFARPYERVVWLDADILIHPEAPSVVDGVPLERIGAAREFDNPTPEVHRHALQTWYRIMEVRRSVFQRNDTPQEFYRAYGFTDGPGDALNAGVMVFSPPQHRELLEEVYWRYEDKPKTLAEMPPLSYEVIRQGVIHWLDPRFNLLWAYYKAARFPFLLAYPEHPALARCAQEAFAESHFMHFAGFHGELPVVDPTSAPVVRRSWLRRRAPGVTTEACDTPVALVAFNRPEATARVMESIRAARPRRLLLVADGPRVDHPDDAERCAAVRCTIEQIDWPCDVVREYSAENLGIKRRFETGLDWVFAQTEEAIILEDDCVPDPTFFRFCGELLQRYRDDARVMAISGSDFTFGLSDGDDSYAFSRYPLIWGWATWRRAWRLHDSAMGGLRGDLERGWLETVLDDARQAAYWGFILEEESEARGTWDYAWLLSCWRHRGLSIHPKANLVSNVGFGAGATHTHDQRDVLAALPTHPMEFPLRHPAAVARDETADKMIEQNVFSGSLDRLWLRLRTRRRALRAAESGRS